MRAFVLVFVALALITAPRLASAGDAPDDVALARERGEALVGHVLRYHETFEVWPELLEDLLDTPDGTRLVEALEPDPWGRPYRLVHGSEALRIVSDGSDGVADTDDDVIVEHTL